MSARGSGPGDALRAGRSRIRPGDAVEVFAERDTLFGNGSGRRTKSAGCCGPARSFVHRQAGRIELTHPTLEVREAAGQQRPAGTPAAGSRRTGALLHRAALTSTT